LFDGKIGRFLCFEADISIPVVLDYIFRVSPFNEFVGIEAFDLRSSIFFSRSSPVKVI